MLLGFWISFTLRARLWIASSVFALVGMALIVVLPQSLPSLQDELIARWAVTALGWTFLLLGAAVLIPMMLSLRIARKQPGREEQWHRWINLLGGLAGALAFAIPASVMFPVFAIAYIQRPNVLFAVGAGTSNLWVAALFSFLGVIVLAATYFLARSQIRRQRGR